MFRLGAFIIHPHLICSYSCACPVFYFYWLFLIFGREIGVPPSLGPLEKPLCLCVAVPVCKTKRLGTASIFGLAGWVFIYNTPHLPSINNKTGEGNVGLIWFGFSFCFT